MRWSLGHGVGSGDSGNGWVLQIVRLPHGAMSDKKMLVLAGFPENATIRVYINGILTYEYSVEVNGTI